MLKLEKITKTYTGGGVNVEALKGITISFRRSEFVAVLGPSGCGKTTLLNIIGGLDHYTTGDLVINGKSTKQYNDRDWDTYRNHSIGFVFQSYNLIPHQTVLENVELALNIAGMGKAQRIQKAKDALDKVGLKGEYNKRPNQLSGGQCQRVAIARALVSDPEILLADEPTGALDTVTSVQIMDLVKEISKERLVIMVTHNPELAEKYSTRTVRLLDGNLIDDSNPYNGEEPAEAHAEESAPVEASAPAAKKGAKAKKSKLSFWSAFKLSARNLWSKFKRTFLVCLAGSIGIIGIASVLSVSTGISRYIEGMQDDMLTGNPITVQKQALNMSGMMEIRDTMGVADALEHSIEDGKINVDYFIAYLAKRSESLSSLLVTNEITQDYIDYVAAMPAEYYASYDFGYGLNLSHNIYTSYNFTAHEGEVLSMAAAQEIYTAILNKTDFAQYSSLISMFVDEFKQAPSSQEFIAAQYDFVSAPEVSRIATKKNEIMIVVDSNQELTDLFLAQMGFYSQEEFLNIVYKATDDPLYDASLDKDQFDYTELLGKKFVWYPNDVVFNKTEEGSPFATVNPFTYNHKADGWNSDDAVELTVTAVLRKKPELSYGSMSSGIYYTAELAQHILSNSENSQIVTYLKDGGKDSITSGHINYNGIPMDMGITYKYTFNFQGAESSSQVGFVGSLSNLSQLVSFVPGLGGMMGGGGSGGSGMDSAQMTSYSLSLRELGGNKLPSSIKIYPKDFATKDSVTDYLDQWNAEKDLAVGDKVLTSEDRNDITYSDNLAIVIDLINSMIDAVTAALVAFTALSLVVSTVMIAIITYVSVIERIKEIGVIRSLGGRKRDVSNLFMAETFIIGGISGCLGVLITYGITAILNLIMRSAFHISQIAVLTISTAVIMIAISIVLTTIAGLTPARLAAKKDPVDALRTE